MRSIGFARPPHYRASVHVLTVHAGVAVEANLQQSNYKSYYANGARGKTATLAGDTGRIFSASLVEARAAFFGGELCRY